MPYIKDGKTYYTRQELEKKFDKYIEKSADDLILNLRRKRESFEMINSKEEIYA